MKKYIIAIDGHSACGKTTLSKGLAKKLGYKHIDTGAMYRCITLYAIENELITRQVEGAITRESVDIKGLRNALAEKKINIEFVVDEATSETVRVLNGKFVEDKIRTNIVNKFVSLVASFDFVRYAMADAQKEMGKEKGIVMEGRDIGTNIFPNAELKLYLTADLEVRADRRYKEFLEHGIDITYNEVLRNLEKRDKLDSTRKLAPLRKAEDAYVLDNTNINQDEQMQIVLDLIEKLN